MTSRSVLGSWHKQLHYVFPVPSLLASTLLTLAFVVGYFDRCDGNFCQKKSSCLRAVLTMTTLPALKSHSTEMQIQHLTIGLSF